MTEVWLFLARVSSPMKQSHALLDRALAQWARESGREGGDLTVVRPRYKKPYLAAWPEVGFSVSRSGERWACAISEQQLGLDLQENKQSGTERIARRFFHPEEQKWLAAHPEDFFRIWTAKESYVKYTGEGVTDQFGDFSVVRGGAIGAMGDGPQFRFLDVGEGYTLCLCGRNVAHIRIIEE